MTTAGSREKSSRIRRGIDMYMYYLEDFKDDPDALKYVKAKEKELYNEMLDRVIANPRFYLDKLDDLPVFMVRFNKYKDKI